MTIRLVHRPARSTRHLVGGTTRTIEAPPNLPEGRTGGAAQVLMPIAGVMSSMVMMTVLRSGQYAAIGVVVLAVTVMGSVTLLFSQRGKAHRTRRRQRERYLEYLEQLREELSEQERERRGAAGGGGPPPGGLYDVVRDPARLWERRRLDMDFLLVRIGTGGMRSGEDN
ncbi:type VII secretion protein EccC, partial [Streptomyces sp. PTM05]|nr:type VII secretion protein EccC [Streptantibioticus parmotrematis]